MGTEPDWVRHAIWWRIYPLGFVDAFPEPAAGPARADEHRLLRVIEWLDHAVELGASGIALGPIFASTSHGYDTLDHMRIDPRLGDEDDFDRLVAAASARGLRVQLDGVFNHLGRDHQRVVAAMREGPDSEAARWLRPQVDDDGRVTYATFEGHEGLVALDHDQPEVRAFVIDVMRRWLDRGVSSWRLDAAYRVPARFWSAVLPCVRQTHPETYFEAEVIHGDYASFVAESTVDAVTQYELWKAVWSSIRDRNLWELDWSLKRHNEMLASFVPATFIGNHDVTRIASMIDDPRHHAHAVVLLAVLGGTPAVYAGDEFGWGGVKEERLGGDDAIRPAFPIGGPAALDHTDLATLALSRRLLGLRRDHPWLHRATSTTDYLTNRAAVFTVAADGEALRVALNLDDAPMAAPDGRRLASDPASGDGQVAPHGWAVHAP